MGSSFCDPTREICPFGAPIDPTLSLVNNIYTRVQPPPVLPGVTGPIKPPESPRRIERNIVMPHSIRSAPLVLQGGGGFDWRNLIPQVDVTFGNQPQGPTRQPPLLPGRIPPGPQVIYPGDTNGCPTGPSLCCPKGHHPDKKWGVKCVRNRRMNALNPRALRRALRRVDQFEDFVNRTAKLTGLRLAKKSTRRK